MEDFEALLKEQETIVNKNNFNGSPRKGIQKAKKGCNYKKFISMAVNALDKSLREYDLIFGHDDEIKNKINDPERKKSIDSPMISYHLVNKRNLMEKKPRIREEVIDNSTDRFGSIYAQQFITIISFKIYSSNSDKADDLVEELENVFLDSTRFFKENGVQEFLFKEQLEDTNYNMQGQNFSIRELLYSVQLEKLDVIFNRKIDNISNKSLENIN